MSDIVERLKKSVGRPRTTTPEPAELIELGKDLVTWATEKTPELRYHLNQWYCLKLGISKPDFELMKDKPEFHPYYEQAQIAIAKRYVDSSIAPAIANRFIRLYFPDVKQDEDEQAAARNKIKDQLNSMEQFMLDIREDMNARTKSQSVRRVPPTFGSIVEDK